MTEEPSPDDSSFDKRSSEASLSPEELRLANILFENDDAAMAAALLAGAGADEIAELLALNEIAELGFEALDRERVPNILEKVATGRLIGNYRLIKEVGAGGMGVCYLARDEALGRLVALKLLSRMSESAQKRFLREAEIAASLNHPNIVEVYGRGSEEGVDFIAMRFVAGSDVAAAVKEEAKSSQRVDRVVHWMARVADALHYAHENGVIHRDVKPGNILIEDDDPYIVDFGLATQRDAMALTRSGDLVGTVAYMAPEQLSQDNLEIDRRVDVYGLGATLYELLSGRVPFDGRNLQALARQIVRRDPYSLVKQGVPRDLEAIVFRAMEKNPERRYATARELREDLDRFRDHRPVRARRLGPLRRTLRVVRRHPWPSLAGLLLGVLLLGTVAVFWTQAQDRQREERDVLRDAHQSALRGDFADAVRRIDHLRSRRDDQQALNLIADQYRAKLLHDEAMQRLLLRRETWSSAIDFADGDQGLFDLVNKARALKLSRDLVERFRAIEVLGLCREGSRQHALRRVDEWESALGSAPPRILAMRYMALEGKESERGGERLEAALGSEAAIDDEDLYLVALAFGYLRGREARGLFAIDRYLKHHPRDHWALMLKGNILLRLRRYAEAREQFGILVANSPRDGKSAPTRKRMAALYQRGLSSAHLGRFADAQADFEVGAGAIRPWARHYTQGVVHRGLGQLDLALVAFREAVALNFSALDQIGPAVGQAERHRFAHARQERATLEAMKGLVACLVDARKFDEALDVAEGMAALETAVGEAETSAMAIRMAEQRLKERETWPETFAELAKDGEFLVENVAGGRRREVSLMTAECLYRSGQDIEAFRRLDEAITTTGDIEARSLRAMLLFDSVLLRRDVLFDRRLRDDASPAERQAWNDVQVSLVEDARRAADDFGVLRQHGLSHLAGIQSPTVLDFVQGVIHFWRGEYDSASLRLMSTTTSFALNTLGWTSEAWLYIGLAESAAGRAELAWNAFAQGRQAAPGHERILIESGRLAAREGWLSRAVDVLESMKTHREAEGYVRRELNAPDWAELRTAPEIRGFLKKSKPDDDAP